MESSSNDRLRDIQRRKEEREREARKKRAFALRCAAAVFAAAILFLIVFGVKSCVSAINQKRAEREAQEQAEIAASATPTPAPVIPTEGNIDNNFYSDSVFIGNSFIDGMEIYKLVSGADYFSRIGLTVKDAMRLSTNWGDVSVIDELKSKTQYSKIFMMFGENELSWEDAGSFKIDYALLIEKAREYQPNAQIYLMGITPVTEAVSNLNENGMTKENIGRFNELILEVAKEENVNFADLYSAVANANGYLPPEAASDGIHFDEKNYKKCLVYIQNAFGD